VRNRVRKRVRKKVRKGEEQMGREAFYFFDMLDMLALMHTVEIQSAGR